MKTHQWQALIEGMLEAVLLVDPIQLRILAANRSAHALLHLETGSLIDKPVVELAAAPEDLFFWEDAAAGLSDNIFSETLLQRPDGSTVQVERRVSLVHIGLDITIYVVAIRDHTNQRQVENELEKLIAELRATLESTADGILVTDLDGGIRSYNHLFAKLWSLPEELLTQRDDNAIYAWLDKCMVDASHYGERLGAINRSPLMEATDVLVLRSGKILERVTLPQYARGRAIGRVYSYRDITQRLADEARLQLAAKVFESSTDAIFITDSDQKIITTNPSFEQLTSYSEQEMIGKTPSDFFAEETNTVLVEQLLENLETKGFWEGELWNRRKNGHAYLCMISLVRVQDESGATMHYIGFFKDRTETHTAKQRIEELAFSDVLTGLPNRLLLAERIKQSITLASRNNGTFALLFLDLDHFKQINDSLGHPFGDRVLIDVTERLKKCIRQVDTASRLGGDEFVLLLHQADANGAEICARRVLEELSAPFTLDGMNFSVTCSIGIALYPDDGTNMDDLIKNADSAMYHVKERGRSDFRFYQRQMNIGLLSRMKIDHAMRQALEHQTFRLYYQPLVNLDSGKIFGAEALIRWHDKDLGEVSPAQFIPIAEETGVIVAIGNWVLTTAVKQAALWNLGDQQMRISVNVSALQFQQSDFVENVARILDEAGLPPDRIELELTESILIRDAEEALVKLQSLADLGVKMAIDDFGTGYSSLSYLKRFPINKLKIDRSFVMHLPDDESDVAIVTAIISLAHALRLRVIAEGVETEDQRNFLQTMNCDELQGYLYSPALSSHDFEAKYLRN
ncbi:EAL domain-containing protein [Undibacterium sp. RTI2.1]|uniref:sensor domain-containing protein n=1 Tax=unclassified Undibacterium TaxID=2630295 RepID=UPI002AB583FD|nr:MULTISPECIES: EAL domain-containing protein [unclassified Undibacterium]MDY7539525.1 EAL domain-containing protein [Undibacterium sp. 5I1]MEB0030172.1 EAL domain-containing protein [Undibacterium sp. RTI2.1]MEB0116700.1 EAL domain-containing protein [Undibacterium sp. RTI2.2]MEB0232298.1 EAL domain-containing protein [Undibacterium sp. 10I3]MEB0258574.1 EAL domain-containing protein [Undibacterium sp. 5I1]